MNGGRGVLGILFIVLGLAGLYGVLSGKFPSSTPLVSATPTTTTSAGANTNQGIQSAPGFGSPNASRKATGDTTASPGGFK